MRRFAALLLAISVCIGVTACSFNKSYKLPGRKDKDIVENQVEILLDAIEDEDVDAIVDMFSEDALDQVSRRALENDIEELIDTFPDWDGDYDKIIIREDNYRSYKADDYFCYNPDITFTVDGEEYELHMVMIYKTADESLLGLRVIQICHEDCSGYVTPSFYSRPGLEKDPGVYCWDYGA